jgi:hypothetical protein
MVDMMWTGVLLTGYRYEPWRLEKLRGLKRKYDPENRFRFFAPLEPHGNDGVA